MTIQATSTSTGRRGATRALFVALALTAPAALLGCEKDEPPPPLPAAPAASPAQQTELTIEEEPLEETEEEPTTKKGGTGKPAKSLKSCCAALRQNAKSAPQPNQGYLETAASICDAAVAGGQSSGAALATIKAAAKSAGLPTACY